MAGNAVAALLGGEAIFQRVIDSELARLSRAESDRLARPVRMLVRTQAALCSRDKALRWLATPNRALAGAVPLQGQGSDADAIAVGDVLERIEHGVSS